ncbi:MAG: carbohydrate hydrolase [Desulfitibacter sp. BRH_c19]|nr:MAG: carbohydrate hydrolase [Desulfitibacter sp. BRH_c19]
MQLTGFRRENGQVGIRNHVVVISSVVCANRTVEMIAAQVPGVIPIVHQHGCSQIGCDKEQTARTLIGFGKNPNVAAVLVVGLGCETLQPKDLAREMEVTGKPVAHMNIQEEGGTLKTVAKGSQIVRDMVMAASQIQKESIDIKDIILGTECGGSDTTSGLAANPATGVASDLLVEAGGTVILSETTELTGTEHVLAKRAKNKEIGNQIYEIVANIEQESKRLGVDIRGGNPTPGNIEGGLTTIEEKSLGCIYKAGTSIINEVIEFAEEPKEKGLVVMDTPGHDIESITGMIAGGAQLIVFTTGRGTPTGAPITPVVKVCGNPKTVKTMMDNIDIDASGIMTDGKSVDEIGREIYQEYLEVINGKQTKSEILGQRDFAICRIARTM